MKRPGQTLVSNAFEGPARDKFELAHVQHVPIWPYIWHGYGSTLHDSSRKFMEAQRFKTKHAHLDRSAEALRWVGDLAFACPSRRLLGPEAHAGSSRQRYSRQKLKI